MDVKKIEDHKFDDLKLKLEAEIENLQKYVKPAELSIEELEKVEPLDEKKIKDFKDEIELLEKEIKERKDKIDLIDKEVKLRVEVREMIDNALKDLDFEDEDINQFLHNLEFCDHIELKEELRVDGVLQLDDEGLPIEVVKEIKHIPWDKESVLKDLKLKLDLDKANLLVLQVKNHKHNKKKNELEKKLKDLTQNNVYFLEAFGEEIIDIKGEKQGVHYGDRISKWDKDDLIFLEEKVKKLEEAKVIADKKEKKEKPIRNRKLEYHKIDDLLFEALVEKHEEGRPEKMVKYLELRKEIKDKHPLED
jgi:hypothetical protein